MTDNDLLKFAAKAAGYDITFEIDEKTVSIWENETNWLGHWNPLEDDGDALRLAVKMGFMDSGVGFALVLSELQQMIFPANVDLDRPRVATRRAIVRAAAEIVKTK